MIPDEAVEVALAAQLSFKNQRGMDNNANLMRHILEAAAPHLMAHRVITTVEELEALPSGSVILDSEGEPNVLHDNGWVLPGSAGGYTTWAVAQQLPVTVLHEPEAS